MMIATILTLEEELANEARRTQLGNDDCNNPNMEGISQDDPLVTKQTQRRDKHLIEEPTGQGKKVVKKVDRASEIIMALQEYTTLANERSSNKKGRFTGSFDHVPQSAGGGDPCSLGRALEVLNQYEDLDDDTCVNIAEYDLEDAYFNSNDDDMDVGGCGDDMDVGGCGDDMDISDCDDDMDTSADTNSEHDSEEEEFWFIFPLIGEMVAHFQRH
ncbi:hypothetical protein SO802_031971 [Lithocarpus litseifolius]|uniref:Uncharacterized protein n=1 Tax=Lithocarpus litseifolius TaxID=425828 RepID=A0AAW2BM25_9ROSI